MIDDADRAQEVDERLASQKPRVTIDRVCVRCGKRLPAEILAEDPDALDCNGACDGMGAFA